MGVKGSGELRFPDHSNESAGQDITEEFGPDGSGEVKLKDYYRGGSKVPNNSTNSNIPDGTSGNTEISLKDFYNSADNSLDGNLAGTTGSFSLAGSNLIPTSNGHPNFDMNTSGTAPAAGFWEMGNRDARGNPGGGFLGDNNAALSTAAIRVGHDQTNKRILLLLLKDGDTDNPAGYVNGTRAAYRILPYVGLENATWTAKIEYNTGSNGYNSTNNTIGTYNGNSGSALNYSTSSTYHTVPNDDTFESVPTFTGMAANGESLISDGSSKLYIWTATVPGNQSNYASSTGAGTGAGGTGTTECRITIKAVLSGETFQTVSSYWDISLSAVKGVF